MRSNEVISRSQFFKKAAKELLADGQPHSYHNEHRRSLINNAQNLSS